MVRLLKTAQWLAFVVVGAVFGSCGDTGETCADGTETCPCVNGFQCDFGLECRSGYCVLSFGSTTATASASSTATASASSTATASGTDGSGSDTNSSGSDSDTGGPGGNFCLESCTADEDCYLGGADQGYTCDGGSCAGATGGCASDAECVALWSGWVTPCSTMDDCPGQVCIDNGDANGWCATIPSEFLTCETINMSEVQFPAFDGSGDVTICAQPDAFCDGSVCVNPCKADADCANYPGSPSCNAGTCECTTDDDCLGSGQPGWTTCNSGVCGCGADADCESAVNADVCNDGFCGCSSSDVCIGETAFDGTTFECSSF